MRSHGKHVPGAKWHTRAYKNKGCTIIVSARSRRNAGSASAFAAMVARWIDDYEARCCRGLVTTPVDVVGVWEGQED